jgi:hypothetical protein
MLGTIKDIITSIKTIFEELHPQNTIFNGEQIWYTKMRFSGEGAVRRRDMRRGVSSQNKAKGIDRTIMQNCIATLLMRNTHDSIRKATYLGATFNSAGRPSELSYCCINCGLIPYHYVRY